VLEEMSEDIMIIDYQLVNYGAVNVLTGKFILIALFNNLCHLSEVSRDSWRIVVDD
jgi:hypothetical protein